MEPRIQLSLTVDQAAAVCAGLDAYTRLCIGQLEEVANLVQQGVIPVAQRGEGPRELARAEVCERIEYLMDEAKRQLGFPANGSNGIGHPHTCEAGRRAYEVQKVLAKEVAVARDPNPQFRGVSYDGLGPRYTTDPAPTATTEVFPS